MTAVSGAEVSAFEGFSLDSRQRRLFGPDGRALPLSGRAFDTLLYLVERQPRAAPACELYLRRRHGVGNGAGCRAYCKSARRQAAAASATDVGLNWGRCAVRYCNIYLLRKEYWR